MVFILSVIDEPPEYKIQEKLTLSKFQKAFILKSQIEVILQSDHQKMREI